MSALDDADGLCGITPTLADCGQGHRVRCRFEFGHGGKCSWERSLSRGPVTVFVHDTTLSVERARSEIGDKK